MKMNVIDIKLKSCYLRPWRPDDAPALVKHADNPRIAMYLRDGFPNPYTLNDAVQWLDSMLKQDKMIVSAIEINGEAAGGIGVIPLSDVYRLTAEIGYWLSEIYWNKGIMSEIIPALSNFIFTQSDIIRIQARIFENNKASMRVLEKSGFHLEAIHKKAVIKLKKMMDEYMWVKLNESESM